MSPPISRLAHVAAVAFSFTLIFASHSLGTAAKASRAASIFMCWRCPGRRLIATPRRTEGPIGRQTGNAPAVLLRLWCTASGRKMTEVFRPIARCLHRGSTVQPSEICLTSCRARA